MRDSVFWNVVFEEYTKKFLDKSNNDFFHIVEQTASDIEYFTEHIERTKRNPYFDFMIIPTKNDIRGNLIEHVVFKNLAWNIRENKPYLISLIKVIEVTSKLLSHKYIGWGEDEEKIKEVIEWIPYFEYYTCEKFLDWIGCFIGCSSRTERIRKAIEEKLGDADET